MIAFLKELAAVRVRDHRGEPVRLAWIDGVRGVVPGQRELPASIFDQARHEVYRANRWKAISLAALAGLVGGVAVLPGLVLAKRTGGGLVGMLGWSIGSAAFLALPVVFGLILPASRRKYSRRLIACVLSRGHCPGCGYDLRGVGTSLRAHTICPECGAGWVVPAARGRPNGEGAGAAAR